MYTAFRRFYKQIVIGTVFFGVVLGVSAWIWHATRPQPTCFDGIKNQNDVEVDCGGVCELLCKKEPAYKAVHVLRTELFKVSDSAYDVLGEIENKNTDFGSPSFGYEFILVDEKGEALASRKGVSYILPQERKHIVEQRLETSKPAFSVKLTISDEQWVEIGELVSANLSIRSKEFSPILEGFLPIGLKTSGVVVNQTGFDFERVDIVIILADASGKELGVGATDVRTLKNGSQRAFEARWPYALGASIARVDMNAYTNLLANENFLVRYGKKREKFQEELPAPSANSGRR